LSNAADDTAAASIELTVRHGTVTGGYISSRNPKSTFKINVDDIEELQGQKLHKIRSWDAVLDSSNLRLDSGEKAALAKWLQDMLPSPEE
jgi:hypothetical protein